MENPQLQPPHWTAGLLHLLSTLSSPQWDKLKVIICFAKTYLAVVNLIRWLENIFTASTIFLLSLSLWLLFATRDSEQVEAFDYSAQECRIPWKFFENFRSVPNKVASMFHSMVLSSPCKYINRCPSSNRKPLLEYLKHSESDMSWLQGAQYVSISMVVLLMQWCDASVSPVWKYNISVSPVWKYEMMNSSIFLDVIILVLGRNQRCHSAKLP